MLKVETVTKGFRNKKEGLLLILSLLCSINNSDILKLFTE